MTEEEKKKELEYEKRLEEERKKWEEESRRKIEEAIKNAEIAATMSAEEKTKLEREKREEELRKREEAVTKRELRSEAMMEISARGLPGELISAVSLDDAQRCKKSIDDIENAFNASIDKRINEILKNKNMPSRKGGSKKEMTYSEYMESLE
ncbi:MAG: DUF4355 domain-containing protein [Firmicutes bacterium]|nr:DUF4355 domain-containing protein [Bacillota bacterium]